MTPKSWISCDYFMWSYGNESCILRSISKFICTNVYCYLYHSYLGNLISFFIPHH